jgi:uncharacterized protein (TIGR00255 family)
MTAIRSMTAFAASELQIQGWAFSWELRSVNHRYLDVSLKIPETLRFLEPDIRAHIAASAKRGRVDVFLNLRKAEAGASEVRLDGDLLAALLTAAGEVELASGRPLASFSALDVMRWPGVLQQTETDKEALAEAALQSLDEALAQLVKVRTNEGNQLAVLVETRCQQIKEIVASVRLRMPQVLDAVRQRLLARLAEITAKVDNDRLEQELVFVAQKLDVAEEMDRLETHIGEVLKTLRQNEPAGRRLDFLLQELNREANTLGSKSADAETTKASVDMKVLIEQIREQVQNIE